MKTEYKSTKCFISIFALVLVMALPVCFAYAKPTDYGLSEKMTVSDYNEIMKRKSENKLNEVQITDILVSWLAEEQLHPSKKTTGLGGGDLDSEYIQAQLILAMWELGDVGALTTLAANPRVKEDIHDAIVITLGMMGDASRIDEVLNILNNDNAKPDFRAMAARALGAVGAIKAIPSLEKALSNSYSKMAGNSMHRELFLVYPVRDNAQAALRKLKDKSRIEQIQNLRKVCEKKLQDAREHSADHIISPSQSVFKINSQPSHNGN